MAWLLAALRLAYVYQASPLQQLPPAAVPLSTHPAYAALGFRTQTAASMEWFPKAALAVVAGAAVEATLQLQNRRDLHGRLRPPILLCLEKGDAEADFFKHDPWTPIGRFSCKSYLALKDLRCQIVISHFLCVILSCCKRGTSRRP